MDEKVLDRWFSFTESYEKESSTPLSYVLCPNTNNGYRTPGSPSGAFKLSKREWQEIEKRDHD